MSTWNEGFVHGDHPVLQTAGLPPWLSTSSAGRPASPSVTLSLASSTVAVPHLAASASWLQQPDRGADLHPCQGGVVSSCGGEQILISELLNGCRELEEGSRALAAHKKEAVWRLNRVELQLESEKASRKREKMDEIESKIRALKEEEKACLERIEAEYREQLLVLKRDAEGKEQKLVDQWTSKHIRFVNLLEQIGGRTRTRLPDAN